jgi:putative flippase GtrA
MLHPRQSNNGKEAAVEQMLAFLLSLEMVRFAGAGGISNIVYMLFYSPLAQVMKSRLRLACYIAFLPYIGTNFYLQRVHTFGHTDLSVFDVHDMVFIAKELVFLELNVRLVEWAEHRSPETPALNQAAITVLLGLASYLIISYFIWA